MRRSGGDKIYSDKKQKKKDLKREKNNKNKISDIIIACEDKVSSPTYFQTIISKLIKERLITQDSFVVANHKHSNPTGVLKDLKNHECDNKKTYKDFDHKWIVIDRDIVRINSKGNRGGHPKEDFIKALKDAKQLKIEVAYANDSFELWYFLHFKYRAAAIARDELLKKVIQELKAKNPHKFSKLDDESIKTEKYTKLIFDEILELQETAVKNAEKLLASHGTHHNPESDNPSTTVHLLVEILNKLGEKA